MLTHYHYLVLLIKKGSQMKPQSSDPYPKMESENRVPHSIRCSINHHYPISSMAIWGPILILRHTPLQLIHGWTWMNNLYRIILDATYQKHMAVENHVQALFDGWVRKICWFEKHPETNPQPHYYAHLCWWISYTKDSLSGHSQLPGSSTDIDWVPWEQGWLVPQRSESQQVNTCWSHAICISQLEHTSKIDITIWYEYIYIYDYICILEFIAQSIQVDLMCQSVWAPETKELSATSCIWHMGSRNRRMHNAANAGSEGLSSTCMFG